MTLFTYLLLCTLLQVRGEDCITMEGRGLADGQTLFLTSTVIPKLANELGKLIPTLQRQVANGLSQYYPHLGTGHLEHFSQQVSVFLKQKDEIIAAIRSAGQLPLGQHKTLLLKKKLHRRGYLYRIAPQEIMDFHQREWAIVSQFLARNMIAKDEYLRTLANFENPVYKTLEGIYTVFKQYTGRRGLNAHTVETMMEFDELLAYRSLYQIWSSENIFSGNHQHKTDENSGIFAVIRMVISKKPDHPLELEIKNRFQIIRPPGETIVELGRFFLDRTLSRPGRNEFLKEAVKTLLQNLGQHDVSLYFETNKIGMKTFSTTYGATIIAGPEGLITPDTYILTITARDLLRRVSD